MGLNTYRDNDNNSGGLSWKVIISTISDFKRIIAINSYRIRIRICFFYF